MPPFLNEPRGTCAEANTQNNLIRIATTLLSTPYLIAVKTDTEPSPCTISGRSSPIRINTNAFITKMSVCQTPVMFIRVLPVRNISCARKDMNKPPLTTAMTPEK